MANDEEVLRRRAAMMFGQKAIDAAERFTVLMESALNECGVPPVDRGGYLIGWLYGQLRKHFTHEQVRAAFESALTVCEKRVSKLENLSR